MRIFSLFLLFGTLLIQWLTMLPSWRLVGAVLCICIIIAIATVFFFKNRSKGIDTVLITICAFLLGLLLARYQASNLINNRITSELEGKELIVTGTVIDIPMAKEDGVRFLLDVNSAKLVENPNEVIKLTGVVRLGWFQQAQEVQAGELWQLKVKLKRPSGFMNPGGFDYERWLFTQRIIATGYVRKSKPLEDNENHNLSLTDSLTSSPNPNLKAMWSVDRWR